MLPDLALKQLNFKKTKMSEKFLSKVITSEQQCMQLIKINLEKILSSWTIPRQINI